ncbi:MAG: efflux transporter periplasmic adaptor subunit [Myxococcales bacterium]|nr:efflux transporter periplasmic adaptor subunit [Myxococcales bacterium]
MTSEDSVRTSWVSIALAAACAVGCKKTEAPAPEKELPTAAVTCKPAIETSVEEVVEVAGVIAPPPRFDAVVSSPIAGRVSQVAVEEGDRVAAGALLATIEDPSLPAGTIEAKAAVAGARATKLAADQDVVRQQRLVETGIGARRDLDEARAKAAAADAELEAANARSGLASKNNARRELRAPHAGVVLHLWKRIGESVDGTTATPVAEVADLTTLELRAQVPPAALMPVREGMPATVKILGIEGVLSAKVARVAPAVDATTLLGGVRIEIEGTHPIAVGSAATGQIVVAHRPGLLVPASALRRSMVGADEVVVCDQGVARIRGVTIGQRREATVEIAHGIVAGEQIVTDRVLGLEEGQPLTAAPPGTK